MEEATRRALEDARRLLDVAATDVDVAPLLAHLVADLDAIVSRHRADAPPATGRAAQEQHLRELLSSSDGGVEASAKGVVDLLWCTLEQAPLAILALDEQARVRLWNPGCERLFGWSAAEALGGPPPFVGPEHAAAFRTNFERVRAGESLAGVEIERRAKDGRTLELQFWTAALHAQSGAFLGLLGMVADISERRALQRELAARERLLDAVFELLPVGVWLADATGQIVRGNAASQRIWGGARWVGLADYGEYRAWRVDTGAMLAAEDWAVHRAITRGEVTSGELLRIQGFDGSFRTIINWALPLREGDRITGAIGVNEDITPLQETKEALDRALARERRLRSVFEAVGEATERVSDAVARPSGSSVDEVLRAIAEGARQVGAADYAAVGLHPGAAGASIDTWLLVGLPQEASSTPPGPDGVIGLATTLDHPLRLDDIRVHPRFRGFPPGYPPIGPLLATPLRFRGARLGTLFLARRPGEPPFTADDERAADLLASRAGISLETARLYEAEAVQRAYLEAVVEQIPLGVVLVDREGRPRAINCAALGLAAPDGAREAPLRAFAARSTSGEPLPPERLPLARALADEETVTGEELSLRAASGADVAVLVNAVPVRGPSGATVGAATTLQDISQLKELERLRVEWAAVVAHDLRAPIGTIGMAAQLLSRLEGPDAAARGQRALEHIRNAVARLNRMVDDLSDVSKLEAHRLDVRRQPVELVALTRDAAERVADLTPGLRVEVRAAAPVAAHVDPTRIEQVVCNLLTNAARHGDPSAVVVVDVLDRGQEAELVVTNRGPGLLPDELPHVFERFARTRRSRDRHVAGLGLGLYISRGLVEAHGGRIWVESTPGETTRFHVVLPRA